MKKKLMIVEDDTEQSEWLYLIFAEKYDIMLARSGEKAQELFQKNHRDIAALILDIRLPDMTAFELLNSLEKMHFDHIPPTVIQSGYEADEWIQKMLSEHRALTYLVKPFDEEDIMKAVTNIIDTDQSLSKGAQVQERMRLLVLLHKIRQHLYHEIHQLPKSEQEPWLHSVIDLFNVYGVKTEKGYPTGTESDFKLKTSLKPVIQLIESFTDYQPFPKPLYSVTIQSPNPQAIELQIPQIQFTIEHTSLTSDFLITELTQENLETQLEFIKSWHHSKPSESPRYSIAVAATNERSLLEQAIASGASLALIQNQTFQHTLAQTLQKLSDRKYELSILEDYVKNLDSYLNL
jgi:CheY-like chemotaxis protein